MILNVGVGGGRFTTVRLDSNVITDIAFPSIRQSNFILSDAHSLPFREQSFELVYAHNILEHVQDYRKVVSELNRVSSHIHLVQDRIWSIGSYQESTHLWFQGFNHKLYRYPRTRIGLLLSRYLSKLLVKWFRFWQILHFTIWRSVVTNILIEPHYEVST